MAFIGQNVEQVRGLAKTMEADSQAINDLTTRLTSELAGVEWVGNDATQFRDDWSGNLAPTLNKIAEALAETAQRATANAQQQEDASAS